MPQRTRPHILEEESRRFFEQLVPTEWVVRTKSHDYGVDLEVEIFSEGKSTGLMFYVQLKATDSASDATKVRILSDRLDYYDSLEIPTLIVRYSSCPPKAMMKWHFNVQRGGDVKASVVHFGDHDELSRGKFDLIKKTLFVLRAAKDISISENIPLKIRNKPESFSKAYVFDSAIERLAKESSVFQIYRGESEEGLIVEVSCLSKSCVISIDEITSATIHTDYESIDDFYGLVVYGSILILNRGGTSGHARELAKRAIVHKIHPPNRELAARAAMVLADDPESCVDLAILSGITEIQDVYFIGILRALQDNPRRSVTHNVAIQRFLRAAVMSAKNEGHTEWEATLNYSLANACRAAGEHRQAFSHYRQAAKLRPVYFNATYFLGEVASVLFVRRRYGMAAKFYEKAYAVEPSPIAAFLAGDALLLAGEVARARNRFDDAGESEDLRIRLEASMKADLCSALERDFRTGCIKRRTSEAAAMVAGASRVENLKALDWNEVLHLDPLEPLANYNGAQQSYSDGKINEAFGRFFVTALAQPEDVDAWHNALACAYAISAELLAGVLTLSVWHCGREPYARMRSQILEADPNGSIVAQLDKVVAELVEQELMRQAPGTIFRMAHPNGYDLIFPSAN